MTEGAPATVEEIERALADTVTECALLWLAEQPEAKRAWGTPAVDAFARSRPLYKSAVSIVRPRLALEAGDARFEGFTALAAEERRGRMDALAKRIGVLLTSRQDAKLRAEAAPLEPVLYAEAARVSKLEAASAPRCTGPYRRDLDSEGALVAIRARMADALRRFEEGRTRAITDDADDPTVPAVDWVLASPADGGLQLSVGPFPAHPPLPAALELGRGEEVLPVPSRALRNHVVTVPVVPSRERLFWRVDGLSPEAREFLGAHAPPWLPDGEVTAFAAGDTVPGARLVAATLAMGGRYRLLVPERRAQAAREALDRATWSEIAPGWQVATLTLPVDVPAEVIARLDALGLAVREAPMQVRLASGGSLGAVRGAGPAQLARVRDGEEVTVLVSGPVTREAGEVRVFVSGGSHWAARPLEPGSGWTVLLGKLPPGRYVVRAAHERSTVPYAELLLEVLPPVAAAAAVIGVGGAALRVDELRGRAFDLRTVLREGDLCVRATPGVTGWASWRGVQTVFLGPLLADAQGVLSLMAPKERVLELAGEDLVADLRLDLGPLGEVVLAHETSFEDASVLARLRELVGPARELLAAARGPLGGWRTIWFAPVCRLLGYGIEVPDSKEVPMDERVPETASWRLLQARRSGPGAPCEVATVGGLLVLPGAFSWQGEFASAAYALAERMCTQWRCRRVLLTDGLRWTSYDRGRRRRARVVDLAEELEGGDDRARATLDLLAG